MPTSALECVSTCLSVRIRFDYGYPIIYDSFNGPPGKFNFNIGYQF